MDPIEPDVRYRFLPEPGAEPGLGVDLPLEVKHAGDEQRSYGRGRPCGRCGTVLNISRRGAGLKDHVDDELANRLANRATRGPA